MIENQFSRTARGAALHRASHQVFEGGAIFSDPYACAILGLTPEQAAEEEGTDAGRRRMRLFIAARARFAEDRLARAAARGVRQTVVLGAGLDTFALRNPYAQAGLRVFEVDHPDTQKWKRERLEAMGMAPPQTLTFAPVDFERDDLATQLRAAGLDMAEPAFFIWLGVTPYLTREATFATLRAVASIPGAEVAFDYTEERERYEGESRAFHEALLARVAAVGEPIVGFWKPVALSAALSALGMIEQEDLDVAAIREIYFRVPRDGAQTASAGHLLWARRPV
ncbi:MAG: class I SAM-dependent methyltransferase [Hyphomicrobiales bacterium]|nr:class I SAM-dependent methyltransferase [Hyphomicrobiales bacterium]